MAKAFPTAVVVSGDPEYRAVAAMKAAAAGCRVVATCDDVTSALHAVDANRPDVVISDVELNGPGGPALVSFLRSIPGYSTIPVLLLIGDEEAPGFDAWSHVMTIRRQVPIDSIAAAIGSLVQEVELRGTRRSRDGAGAKL